MTICALGSQRHCSSLRHVLPHDPCFRPISGCARDIPRWPILPHAKANSSAHRPGACLGFLFCHTLWLRQFAQTHQVGAGGPDRKCSHQSFCKLVSENVQAFSASPRSNDRLVVHLPIWSVRDSQKQRCILAINYKSEDKSELGHGY